MLPLVPLYSVSMLTYPLKKKRKRKEIAALVIVIAIMPSLLSRLYVLVIMIIRYVHRKAYCLLLSLRGHTRFIEPNMGFVGDLFTCSVIPSLA